MKGLSMARTETNVPRNTFARERHVFFPASLMGSLGNN